MVTATVSCPVIMSTRLKRLGLGSVSCWLSASCTSGRDGLYSVRIGTSAARARSPARMRRAPSPVIQDGAAKEMPGGARAAISAAIPAATAPPAARLHSRRRRHRRTVARSMPRSGAPSMTSTTRRPSSSRVSAAMTPRRLTSAVAAAIRKSTRVARASRSRSASSAAAARKSGAGTPSIPTVGVTSATTVWKRPSPLPPRTRSATESTIATTAVHVRIAGRCNGVTGSTA